ncbi:ATP-binding protein [Pseudomonas tolaasii]|uniref:ATP-binding protein n=1 Tax=Pseudomonas tolaasii TaxID=29442 RepID=UPI00031FD02C|nr:ATP-binding protein [Pseudomonas tolaasii]NWC27526.1 HAMP domain-containing protein [Pseudomonas tolaasii]NWC50621.1 HAMP domain-containing protein [Pseudomonas tolaasii]NWE62845.1 HAMP domain-containing protein [Pseudomonas tolaasii]WLH51046.1 ATP-binding protein [Pseudomonas tolaasii]
MKRLPRDTVARWIALTILLAMFTALAFNALFVQLAGVWARPPLTEIGLLEKIAVVVRAVEASEPARREHLTQAVGDEQFSVTWATERETFGLPEQLEPDFHSGDEVFKHLLPGPPRLMAGYEPSDWPDGKGHYALVVRLVDHSWLMFSAQSRSWGLGEGQRSLIVLLLVLISTALVTLVATRRLARPLQQFAQGARRFGSDFRAPPIEPVGPHEIRQAILAFNGMQAQLQHFIQDRTQMLAAISHDLRAPLTRLRLRGEFIEDIDQQQRLFRDVDEMQAMINTALEFFRDDARLEQATQLDLAELLQTLIDDYRDQNIDISFRGPPRLVYCGRPLGLKRVITNLVENAIHYGTAPEIELLYIPGEVVIHVLDRGPGIPAEHREQVFLPFYRLEGSRNKSTGGVGLGLSTARAIVLEHGGTLTLAERQGGGLVAVIVLPV